MNSPLFKLSDPPDESGKGSKVNVKVTSIKPNNKRVTWDKKVQSQITDEWTMVKSKKKGKKK